MMYRNLSLFLLSLAPLFVFFHSARCQNNSDSQVVQDVDVLPAIRPQICGNAAEEQAKCAIQEQPLVRRELYDMLGVGNFTDYLSRRANASTWHNLTQVLSPRQATKTSHIYQILQHSCPGNDCDLNLINLMRAGDRASLHQLLGHSTTRNKFTVQDLMPLQKLLAEWQDLGVNLSHEEPEPEPKVIDTSKEGNKTHEMILDEQGDKTEVPGPVDMNEDGKVTVDDHERVIALGLCKGSPPTAAGYRSSEAHLFIKDMWEVWHKAHPFPTHLDNFANDVIADLVNSTESPALEKPCPNLKECHPHICDRVARINATKPENIMKTTYALEAIAWFEERAWHTGRLVANIGLSNVLKNRKLIDQFNSDAGKIKEQQMKMWDQFVLEDHLLYAGVFGLGMLFLDASDPNNKPDYRLVQDQAKWFDEVPNVHVKFKATVADLGANLDLEKAFASQTDPVALLKGDTIGLVFGMFELLVPNWAKQTLQGIPDHVSGKALPDFLKDIENWEYPEPKDKGAVTRLFYGVLVNRAWRLQHTYIVEADVQKDHCKVDTRGQPDLRVCLDEEPHRVYYLQHVRPDAAIVNSREVFAKVSGPRGYKQLEHGITLEDIVRSSLAHYRDHHFSAITGDLIKGLHYLDFEWVKKIGGRMPGIFTIPVMRNPGGQAISKIDGDRGNTNYPCMAGPVPWVGGKIAGAKYEAQKDYSHGFMTATCLYTHPFFQNQCETQQGCKAEGGKSIPKIGFSDNDTTYCYGEHMVHDLPFRYCLGHKGREYPTDS